MENLTFGVKYLLSGHCSDTMQEDLGPVPVRLAEPLILSFSLRTLGDNDLLGVGLGAGCRADSWNQRFSLGSEPA